MMNERIKELAKQVKRVCGDEISHFERVHNRPLTHNEAADIYNEKFAELIVKECADIIQQEVSLKYKDGGEAEEFMNGHYAASLLARVKIKHHFKVK
jgi:hypothetical protein